MAVSDAFHHRIKAAQRDLITRCGGIMRAVEITNFSKSQVGRWNSPTDAELMPVNAIVALEEDAGVALVTAVLAEANGRRLTDPDEERAAEAGLLRSVSEMMRHWGEFGNAFGNSIADGNVTPTEATTCERPLAKLEAAISEVHRSLAAIKANGGGAAKLRVVADDQP
ncbi:hypothetical protein [Martelella sp. HB161492]|uniref:hypothetical protein n=1 Tax=Martelella sp. HB161492 TaxID=2720726 RepID=UPI0015904C22|nr:hypothetical protein [Martelella sp. HB161492]